MEYHKQIEEAAREAGEIIRSAHRQDMHVTQKTGRFNFVTEYDKKVQEFLFERLRKIIPDARFLGEEDGADRFLPEDEKGWLFVIDPIDGTTNFMHDMHPHVTSIGLFRDGKPYAGVVYCPGSDQMFSAGRGCGAFENGRPIHVSEEPLSGSIVIAGTAGFSVKAAEVSRHLTFEFQKKCQGYRSLGSAEYNLCMVASGRAGAYYELRLCLWDYAAGSVILEEAGGKISDWNGAPLAFRGNDSILAGAPAVLADPAMPDTARYLAMFEE